MMNQEQIGHYQILDLLGRGAMAEVPSKQVVCFPPEGLRSEFIPPGVDPARLVFGGITPIALPGDRAEGEDRAGAVHYWLPPLTQIPLMGAEAACRPVVDLFKKAGVRAAIKKEASARCKLPPPPSYQGLLPGSSFPEGHCGITAGVHG